jgi:hypothetical protein
MMKCAFLALLACACSHANAEAVSPIERVIIMMTDLQTQVITEGKAEATTYDKFACFCKDTSNEKNTAITEAQDTIAALTGSINQLTADREGLDEDIAELNENLEANAKSKKEADDERHHQKNTFDSEKAELVKAIGDLGNAIATAREGADMPQGHEVGFIQLKPVLETVKKAVWMADALGMSSKSNEMLAMLQGSSKMTDSAQIVELMEQILDDFKKQLAEVENTETQRIADHNLVQQTLHDERNAADKDLKEAEELKAEKMSNIGSDQQDLTATNAKMTDDQAYIKDLTEKCNLKSREWEQRSSMRSDELTALTTALTIVKSRVTAADANGKTVRLVEETTQVLKAAVPTDAPEEQNSDVSDDEIDGIVAAESFLQLSKPRSRLALIAKARAEPEEQQAKRELVLSLLRSKGAQIGSAVLTSLASKVSADPFAKIKQLIQELIERLLQEAADEANHKGWCDKELGKAKQSRKLKSEAVSTLNSALAEAEAKRDKLSEEISVLTTEIAELEESLAKTTKERNEESAENSNTIHEAQEGKAAIEEAIEVLDHFYKTAAKAADVTLLQQPDMPDAGFDGANRGSQSASKGILGMMEVILSDFERTISSTEKWEKEAAAEFLEFETTTKVSIGKKTSMKTNKEQELTETNSQIAEDNQSLLDEQALLDKSIQEIQELQPACVETGMSYEDRVAKREQEIESLKEALCVLDKEGPVQTEGC